MRKIYIYMYLGTLVFPTLKSSAILRALLFVLLSSIILTLSTKVRNFLLGGISTSFFIKTKDDKIAIEH